ncbi:hypothetical protein HYW76_00675 [Candidatus Pacearchaeota archaeon]|nr:hypothetical protein [Candidatus Pacearchaeota archaeon]
MKTKIILPLFSLIVLSLASLVSASSIIEEDTGGYFFVSVRDETPNCDLLKYFKEDYGNNRNSDWCMQTINGYYSSSYNDGNDGTVIINKYVNNIDNAKFVSNIKEMYGSEVEEREVLGNNVLMLYNEEGSTKSTSVAWYSGDTAIVIGAGPFELSVSDDPLIAGILQPYFEKYPSSLNFEDTQIGDEEPEEIEETVSRYIIKSGLGDYSLSNNGEEINCDLLHYLKDEYDDERDFCEVSAYAYYSNPKSYGQIGSVSVDVSSFDINNKRFVKYIKEKYGSEVEERELLDNNVLMLYKENSGRGTDRIKSTTIIWHTNDKAIIVFSGDFELSVSDDSIIGGFVNPYFQKYPSTLQFVDEEKLVEPNKEPVTVPDNIASEEKKEFCIGCMKDNKCFPIGYRTSSEFCSGEKEIFLSQEEADASCNNNFECSSNLCIDGQCVSSGLWQKILRFFKNLFG